MKLSGNLHCIRTSWNIEVRNGIVFIVEEYDENGQYLNLSAAQKAADKFGNEKMMKVIMPIGA